MINNYPTVNYIGNKEKIVDWIVDAMPVKKKNNCGFVLWWLLSFICFENEWL